MTKRPSREENRPHDEPTTAQAVKTVSLALSRQTREEKTVKHEKKPNEAKTTGFLRPEGVKGWEGEAGRRRGDGAIAIALATAAHTQSQLRQELSAELVWTGPNPEALPLRRTDQTLLQLIWAAKKDLLIVSFAIYNIPEIVQALIAALNRGVHIRIIAETPNASEGKISFGIEATFGSEILKRSQIYIWPKEKRPVDEQGRHGSLHTKCAVCDQQHLFISSANLTEYAMSLNIEMGILIHNRHLSEQIVQQVNSLISYGNLARWKPAIAPSSEQ